MWQFLCGIVHKDSVARMVSLYSIYAKDQNSSTTGRYAVRVRRRAPKHGFCMESQERIMHIQLIKIESIKYGWFEMRFGKHYIDCSDYLGNDIPKRLLKAAYDLLVKKTKEEWIRWDDEPGASIMNLELLEDKILITVYSALQPSYDLFRSSKPLKENCGKQEWSELFDSSLFVDELVTEFILYKDGTGLAIYEKNWMAYPEKELAELKAYAIELSKSMGKYDKLFCTSYL